MARCRLTDIIGKTIFHYKLFKKIRQGRMEEVYRAEDSSLKREVAIKVLPNFRNGILSITLILFSTSVGLAQGDDHGNDCSSATSVSVNSTRTGSIETGGDSDYFRVQVPTSGTLTVYTTGSTDTFGELRNSACSIIASNDDAIFLVDLNFRISRSVNSGTYYVAVRHFDSSSGTGSYTLNVELTLLGSGGGEDGTQKWAFQTEGSVSSSPAIGDDGTVYVGSSDFNLYAINPDGTQKWAFQTEGSVSSSPAIGDDGTVYVGSADFNLYAINPDGTQKWAFLTGGGIRAFSSPAIGADGTVYVGSDDFNLYAINPDGTQKWVFATGSPVRSSPAIGTDGTLYVGSPDFNLYAINPDGTQKWAFPTFGGVFSSPAIGADGTVYVGSTDSNLYAINPDGTQKWILGAQDVGLPPTAVVSSPAIGVDGTIYVGADGPSSPESGGFLLAINPDGTLKWPFFTLNDVRSSPAIGADGTVYVGSFDGNLYAINPDGTQKWAFQTSSGVFSSPAIGADGTVYAGSLSFPSRFINGSLYAINGSSGGLSNSPWPMFHHDVRHTGQDTSSSGGDDHGNDCGSATSVSVNSTRSGSIETGGDSDYFQVQAPSSGTLTVYTTGSTDTFGELRNSACSVIASNDNSTSLNFRISQSVSSATYYVVVRHFSNFGTGSYTLNVEFTASSSGADGTQKWAFPTVGGVPTGRGVGSSPAIGADGTLYVGSDDHNLYGINPDGTQKWAFLTGTPLLANAQIRSSPAIGADGTLYVGDDWCCLYAINPDGTQKWALDLFHQVFSSPAIGEDGTLYVGGLLNLHAINPDGTLKWTFPAGGLVTSSPAIGEDGTLYVGGLSNLYAINPDGTQKWGFLTGDFVSSSPAIGADGTLYVGSDDFNLYAINPDGTQKWAFLTGGRVTTSPAIGADGTLYVGSADGSLYAINTDGTQKWTFPTGGGVFSSPAIGADGTLYVGSSDFNLYAINSDGTQKWAFPTGDTVESSPAIGADGTIYVGSDDGNLYAINGSSGGLSNSPWPMFHHDLRHTGRVQLGTVLVANFMNGNNAALNSRVYLFNPSQSAGDVTVRVFTLPLTGGLAQELTVTPFYLGSLEGRSALNLKLVEDILTPLGMITPYTDDGGNLTLEFTIEAPDVRGAAQVFSSDFAFGTYPLQEIPSTSGESPTVLIANFTNGNNAALNSRVYLFNPSQSAGDVTVRVFTLPLTGGLAQELTVTPFYLGSLEGRSALNLKLVEDILTPLGMITPYTDDGGNLTLEFTIEAPDVRGAAQVFSSDFAFGTYPIQEIPSALGESSREPFSFVQDVLVVSPSLQPMIQVVDKNGQTLPPSELTFTVTDYLTQQPDTRLQIDSSGTVRVIGDIPGPLTAFRVKATYNGEPVQGIEFVVVHDTDKQRTIFETEHWRLIVPPDWIAQTTESYPDFGLALDLGWQAERELMGKTSEEAWNDAQPHRPAVSFQALAEDPLACGGSGNPMRFGRDCFFDPNGDPRWHFYFHEMGHNTSIAQQDRAIFCQLMCSGRNFVEGEANLFGMWALRRIGASAQLSASTRASIVENTQEGFNQNTALFLSELQAWEASGETYDENAIGAEFIWNGIQVTLADEFGWDYVFRYVRSWRNDPVIRAMMNVDTGGTTETSRATFAAAALSAAVRNDLRQRFINDWRFPLDEDLFTALYTHLVVAMDEPWADTFSDSSTVLIANFTNGNNTSLNSRIYLWNPSTTPGNVTVRVFTLPLTGGTAQELTDLTLSLGVLEAKSARNVKLAEDILTPLGMTTPYTDNGGNLTLEFTIEAPNVRGAAQVFSSDFAFGTYPLQEIPATSGGSPTVLVANFTNGNNTAFNSRVYLWNPSASAGNVTVRVFTLPLSGGTALELTAPLDLGTLGAKSALNVKVVEDILTPLGITTPYTTDGGNLTLEFTIEAADVRGAVQVFSDIFAFGTYPLQVLP